MSIISFKGAIIQVYSKFNSGVSGPIVTLECLNMQWFIKDKRTQSSMRQLNMREYKFWESFRNIKRLGQINLLPINCHLKVRIQTMVTERVSILKSKRNIRTELKVANNGWLTIS